MERPHSPVRAFDAAAERELSRLLSEPPTRVEAWAAALGRWQALCALLAAYAGWASYNLAAPALGGPQLDPPPFFWLQRASLLGAFVMLWLVVASRRRQVERDRALLTLLAALYASRREAPAVPRDCN